MRFVQQDTPFKIPVRTPGTSADIYYMLFRRIVNSSTNGSQLRSSICRCPKSEGITLKRRFIAQNPVHRFNIKKRTGRQPPVRNDGLFIINRHQKQPLRRQGNTRPRTVAAFQRCGQAFRLPGTRANFQQGAREDAHHVL